MTQNVHELYGCAPSPLAHYLKGLGVLRLTSQQADRKARAFWRNDDFGLVTTLSRAELLAFFLERYAPTPMLTPWNGGSGFYPKDRKAGIDALSASTLPRFEAYRQSIESARALVAGRVESPKNEEKAELLKACKANWSGAALDWANAAAVITQASEIAYPALLGSGGNDGRLDFANNFMQRLIELLPTTDGKPPPASAKLLEQSLFRTPSRHLADAAIGQFLPGAAGGVNASTGFKGDSLVNPWDYVLMLEGAMLLQVASVRRLDGTRGASLPQASAPFAVRSRAAGYASAAHSDESARGEQWFPLWSRPATLSEVQALFMEGRLQAGTRRAGEALEAAQAIARLGVARGVTSFLRYAYAERNGQANLAVPLGRWDVGSKPRREAQLVEEVEDWIARLRRAGAQQAAFDRHARRLDGLALALCQQSGGNASAQIERLLEALGSAEAELLQRPRATASAQLRPLPPLSEAWLHLVGDKGSSEFRLALAIATQGDERNRSLRTNLAPLEGTRFRVSQDRLAKDPEVVWTDRDLVEDLGAVVLRRLTTSERVKLFPLVAGIPASLQDVVEFLEGRVDEPRVARLTRALLALSRSTERSRHDEGPKSVNATHLRLNISSAYALFRVLHSPWDLSTPLLDEDQNPLFPALRPRSDPSVLRQLLAGRLEPAAAHAVDLLRQGGARPRMTSFMGSAVLARRIVASLAIPISWFDTNRLGALVFKPELVGQAQEKVALALPEPQSA